MDMYIHLSKLNPYNDSRNNVVSVQKER